VIKNIAYFPSQCALNSKPVMGAVLDCLQLSGIQTQENSWDSDAAVIWSVLWHGRMKPNQAVYEHYRAQNKPVIVIEIGSLYRGNTWKIAVNNITSQGYYGHVDNLDWDRPRKLQISLATQIMTKPNIVIALQHAQSLQVATIPNMCQWITDTVNTLTRTTDRPITIRPHPRSRIAMPVLPPGVTVEKPRPVANTYDSFNMHFDCHAVVNYNSGPGIQSAIAGTRPIVDSTSLAYPVGVGFDNIEQPYDIDRQLWLTQICHTEYTLDELKRGIWLRRITPALEQLTVPV
jgi:hypothetical protein